VNGDAQSGFMGLRNLTDAIQEVNVLFPGIKRSLTSANGRLISSDPIRDFPQQVQRYYQLWHVTHNQEMEVTAYQCTLCMTGSLRPLLDAKELYEGNVAKIQQMFAQTQTIVGGLTPLLNTMVKSTLPDVLGLYKFSLTYAKFAQDRFSQLDPVWNYKNSIVLGLLICSLIVVLACTIALVLARHEAFAFCAWWLAFFNTAFLLVCLGMLLSFAVAGNDACLFAAEVLTPQGIQTYTNLFPGLNRGQQSVLSSCLTPGGDGEMRKVYPVNIYPNHSKATLAVTRNLQGLPQLLVDKSMLDKLWSRYTVIDGNTYRATWNASQSLAWHGEPTGVNFVTQQLRSLSAEHWAFKGADAPSDCALAQPFTKGAQIATWNCWFITPKAPTSSDLKSRYTTLMPDQLQALTAYVAKARSTALGLQYVLKFRTANADILPQVKYAWRDRTNNLVDLANDAKGGILQPMSLVSAYTQQLATSTNCRYAYNAYSYGATSVCQDLVSSTMVTAICFGILAAFSFMILLLSCLMWSMYQSGRHDGSRYLQVDVDSDEEGSDDSDGYSREHAHQSADDLEMELYQPLDPVKHKP